MDNTGFGEVIHKGHATKFSEQVHIILWGGKNIFMDTLLWVWCFSFIRSLLSVHYLCFHKLSLWLEGLVSVSQDTSSETSDTQAASWDLFLWLREKKQDIKSV